MAIERAQGKKAQNLALPSPLPAASPPSSARFVGGDKANGLTRAAACLKPPDPCGSHFHWISFVPSSIRHEPLIAGRRKSHVCLMHASAASLTTSRPSATRLSHGAISLTPQLPRLTLLSLAVRPPFAEGLIRHATSIPRNTLGDHDDKRKLDNETLVRSNQRIPILSGSALIRKDDCGEDDNET